MWVEAVSFLLKKNVDFGDCAGVSFPCHTPSKIPCLRSFACTVLQSHHICSFLAPILLPSPDLTALLTSTYIVCDRSHFQLCTCLQITAHPVPGISVQLLKLLVTSLPHHSPFQLLSLFAIIFCLHQSLTCSLFT